MLASFIWHHTRVFYLLKTILFSALTWETWRLVSSSVSSLSSPRRQRDSDFPISFVLSNVKENEKGSRTSIGSFQSWILHYLLSLSSYILALAFRVDVGFCESHLHDRIEARRRGRVSGKASSFFRNWWMFREESKACLQRNGGDQQWCVILLAPYREHSLSKHESLHSSANNVSIFRDAMIFSVSTDVDTKSRWPSPCPRRESSAFPSHTLIESFFTHFSAISVHISAFWVIMCTASSIITNSVRDSISEFSRG